MVLFGQNRKGIDNIEMELEGNREARIEVGGGLQTQNMAKKIRTEVPEDRAAEVLFLSNRTCCVCRDESNKSVQIHHIDGDPSNHEQENLAVLCLECHDRILATGGFGRKLNAAQVVLYRDDWHRTIAEQRAVHEPDTGLESQASVPACEPPSLPDFDTPDITYRANIHLELVEHGFGRSYGTRRSPFHGVSNNPMGCNKQGVPDWGTLWARIRFKNAGLEEGSPIPAVDKSQIELPPLFDSDRTKVEFFPPRIVAGRTETGGQQFFFDVLFTERDPCAFAEALKTLVDSGQRYRIVISYKTHCVDGDFHARELIIEGDFRELHQSVLEYWDGYGFGTLADLARLDEDQED